MKVGRQWQVSQAQETPRALGRCITLPKTQPHIYIAGNNQIGWDKRLFDITLSLILLAPLTVVMIVVAAVLLIEQGRPILFVQWRMQTPHRAFPLIKFRTMVEAKSDFCVTGADQNWRITRLGRFLRDTRLDELPQLFNILRGHMSFVGPRPPTPELVHAAPEVFAEVLQTRPGVTGLATLIYHRREYHILKHCRTSDETRDTYLRRCLPAKARIDLIYQDARSLRLDLWIIANTIKSVVFQPDRPFRRHRRRFGKKRQRRR